MGLFSAAHALAIADDGAGEAQALARVGMVKAVVEGLDRLVEGTLLALKPAGFAFDVSRGPDQASPVLFPHGGKPVFSA